MKESKEANKDGVNSMCVKLREWKRRCLVQSSILECFLNVSK